MRKLVVTENVTLDGVIDASEGWFSPAGDEEVDRSDITEALREQAGAADVLLVPTATGYKQRASHQPESTRQAEPQPRTQARGRDRC
jgi:hypothetical protein